MPTTRRLLIGLLVASSLLYAGCGTDGAGAAGAPERVRGSLSPDVGDPDHVSKAEDEVGRDDHATPGQVFAAGSPETMSVRPDGSLIVTYLARSDTEGEGPSQTAWRAFDANGHRLAQGRRGGSVQAVADGFVIVDGAFDSVLRVQHVDPNGMVTEVRTTKQRSYPRRGDTLVEAPGTLFRPSTGGLFRATLPTRGEQPGLSPGRDAALSDTGDLYRVADPPTSPLPVAVTADAGRTWRTTEIPIGRSKPYGIAAAGRTAAIGLSRDSIDGGPLAGLAVTHDAGQTWSRAAAGLPLGEYVDAVGVGADERVLVGGFDTGWWRATSAAGTSYEQVPLPPGGVSDVEAASDHLVALASTGLWSSTDDGRHWTRVKVASPR